MPSNEQFQELINNCYWVWTDGYNGTEVKGYIAYKVNEDKSTDKGVRIHQGATPDEYYTLSIPHIFFPAAGSYIFVSEDENKIQSEGLLCNYWSASLGETNSNYAKYMVAGRTQYDLHIVNEVERKPYGCFGYSVRAVKAKDFNITLTQPTENGTIRLVEETIDLDNKVRERTVLHFVAEPDENYELDSWSGCHEDGYLIVTGDATVTCTFKPKSATAVKNIKSADSKVQKVVENGTLYIIKDGEKYNLQGVRKAE
ncbi:MAG: hypothetical protein J6Y82_08200 [Bacteroidales bacterium]|nr:hypothetical protein [Bacteroidales bacterium]